MACRSWARLLCSLLILSHLRVKPIYAKNMILLFCQALVKNPFVHCIRPCGALSNFRHEVRLAFVGEISMSSFFNVVTYSSCQD